MRVFVMKWWAGRDSNPHAFRTWSTARRAAVAQPTHCGGGTGSSCGPWWIRPPNGCALGADDGTRTRNLRFTKPLLYQLSYVGATRRVIPQSTRRRRGMIGPLARAGQARGVRRRRGSGPRWFRRLGAARQEIRRRPRRPRSASDEGSACGSAAGSGLDGLRLVQQRFPAPPRHLRAAPVGSGADAQASRRRRVPGGVALGNGLEQEDRPRDGGVERADRTAHRDPHEDVAAAAHGRAEALTLAADDDRERAPEVGLPGGQRASSSAPRSAGHGCGGRPGRPAGRRRGTGAGARRRRPRP